MQYEIKNRLTGKVQFTADINCNEDEKASAKIGLAVKWAIENGADLSGANLSRANLSRADLRGANLRVKTPPLTDRYFISEILKREARKDYKKLSFAGFIRINLELCWYNVSEWNIPKNMIVWARKVLCKKWPEFEEQFDSI